MIVFYELLQGGATVGLKFDNGWAINLEALRKYETMSIFVFPRWFLDSNDGERQIWAEAHIPSHEIGTQRGFIYENIKTDDEAMTIIDEIRRRPMEARQSIAADAIQAAARRGAGR